MLRFLEANSVDDGDGGLVFTVRVAQVDTDLASTYICIKTESVSLELLIGGLPIRQ